MFIEDVNWSELLSGGDSGGLTAEPLSVTQNGNYSAPSGKAYTPVTVDVPNSYTNDDEGKVVSSGELVAQTSITINENGTYNTTENNEIVVDVSSSDTSFEDALIMRELPEVYENSTATSIGDYVFYECSIVSVTFSAVTTIGNHAFDHCTLLTSATFPVATSIGWSAFYSCSSLTNIAFPEVKTIGNCAFWGCTRLINVSFPAATSLGVSVFQNCSNMTTISFPNLQFISYGAFYNCYSLLSAYFPAVATVGSSAFYNCRSLTTVSLPAATYISAIAFGNCYNLISLYLMGSSVVSIYNSAIFSSTPIGGYSASAKQYGSIYVPASLLSSYKANTSWSRLSSRFVGVEEEP